jgi:L-amino acid N-acyltransferase
MGRNAGPGNRASGRPGRAPSASAPVAPAGRVDPTRRAEGGAPVELRRASESDLPAIVEIYNEAVRTTTGTFDTEPRSLDDRTEWFRSHDARHPIFVARSDGRVVGWASLSVWSERRAYDATGEVSVYVAEPARGRGVGRALLERLVAAAAGLEFHTLLARVAEGNLTSLRLHADAGFVTVGVMREVGTKFGRRLDVHLLQRMVAESSDRSDPATP